MRLRTCALLHVFPGSILYAHTQERLRGKSRQSAQVRTGKSYVPPTRASAGPPGDSTTALPAATVGVKKSNANDHNQHHESRASA